MRIQTVNVIEVVDDSILQLVSFPDSPEGNKEAEELFVKIIKEDVATAGDMEPTESDIQKCIEDGVFCNGGNYSVALIHSTN